MNEAMREGRQKKKWKVVVRAPVFVMLKSAVAEYHISSSATLIPTLLLYSVPPFLLCTFQNKSLLLQKGLHELYSYICANVILVTSHPSQLLIFNGF